VKRKTRMSGRTVKVEAVMIKAHSMERCERKE
jgi:hypothetical protein